MLNERSKIQKNVIYGISSFILEKTKPWVKKSDPWLPGMGVLGKLTIKWHKRTFCADESVLYLKHVNNQRTVNICQNSLSTIPKNQNFTVRKLYFNA